MAKDKEVDVSDIRHLQTTRVLSIILKVQQNLNDAAYGKNSIDLYFELEDKAIKELEQLKFKVLTVDIEELQASGHSHDGIYHTVSWK